MPGARKNWTTTEDRELRRAFELYGDVWPDCAAHLASRGFKRNSDQCSQHWRNVLDPALSWAGFTMEDDELLLREMGLPTASIAAIRERHFKDKSYYRVRDRFRTLTRKQKETVQVSGRIGAHIRVRVHPARASAPPVQDTAQSMGATRRNLIPGEIPKRSQSLARRLPSRSSAPSTSSPPPVAGPLSSSSNRYYSVRPVNNRLSPAGEQHPPFESTQDAATLTQERQLLIQTATKMLESPHADLRQTAKDVLKGYLKQHRL